MSLLLCHQAKAATERLATHLSADNRGRLEALIDTLGKDGRTTVGAVQAKLFPAISPASANKALDRLIKVINDTARKHGLGGLVEIDADKKLGAKRHIWFESDQMLFEARRKALSTIPKGARIEDIRGRDPGKIVAILTFNEHERAAVRAIFNLGSVEERTAEDAILGQLGEYTILHSHSLAGQGQVNAEIGRAHV